MVQDLVQQQLQLIQQQQQQAAAAVAGNGNPGFPRHLRSPEA